MSNHTTLCANVLCANSAKMNGLILETSSDSNTGAITSSTDSVPLLTLKNTNTDANSAAVVQLKSHPSDNVQTDADEIGLISFVGVDAAGATAEYGAILCSAPDTDASGEEGKLSFNLATAGARVEVMSLTAGTTQALSTVAVPGLLSVTSGTQTAAVARTATADGTGTGTIADGTSFVSVTSANADHIVILPSPTVGNIVHIHVGANGCELRPSAPRTVAINGTTPGADHESALPANSVTICICVSTTAWVAFEVASNGAVSATEVAA